MNTLLKICVTLVINFSFLHAMDHTLIKSQLLSFNTTALLPTAVPCNATYTIKNTPDIGYIPLAELRTTLATLTHAEQKKLSITKNNTKKPLSQSLFIELIKLPHEITQSIFLLILNNNQHAVECFLKTPLLYAYHRYAQTIRFQKNLLKNIYLKQKNY